MKVTVTEQISPKSQEILKALQEAVAEELDKKKRLGQYAVVWQGGRPVRVEAGMVEKAEGDTRA